MSTDNSTPCDHRHEPRKDLNPALASNVNPHPKAFFNPYQLTRHQKQCTMILSTTIRHCLLPCFSQAIESIFADCYDQPGEPTNDPVELIDRRSSQAASRLKLLIGNAFDQIYHQLLVVGLEELATNGEDDDGPGEDKKDELPVSPSHTSSSTSSLSSSASSSNLESSDDEEKVGMGSLEYEETCKLMVLYNKKDRRIRRNNKNLKGNRNRRRKKIKQNQNQLWKQLVEQRRLRQQQQAKQKLKKLSKKSSNFSGSKSNRRARKLVALVVSRAMAAAIAPDMERLVWTLRNEHVAQILPAEVKSVEVLMRRHQGAANRAHDVFEDEDEMLDADSANTLYSRSREPFRRAVYETFFADPTRSTEPLTLARKTAQSNNLCEMPNVSRLQRHLLAAVVIAVRSGYLLFLDRQIVLEIGAKFDIRLERRRHLDGELSFFEFSDKSFEAVEEDDGYLEDDDETVTIDPAFVSPLKSKFFKFCFFNFNLTFKPFRHRKYPFSSSGR